MGEKHFRQQVTKGLKAEYNLEYQQDEILFTPGGQFGLALVFHLLEQLMPTGCIVTPRPWYVNHHELAHMFIGDTLSVKANPSYDKFQPVEILDHPQLKITPQSLQKAIDMADKPISAFLFCNPGNPLGNVMYKEDWLTIVDTLRAYPDVPIILDEAFTEIVFDDERRNEISLLHAAPDLQDRVFLFRSGTKALGLAGERLAVLAAPKKYIQALMPLQSRLMGNTPLLSQAGMAAALMHMTPTKKKTISDYYQKNAEFLYEELKALGLVPLNNYKPEGGFYFLIDLSALKGKALPQEAAKILGNSRDVMLTDRDIAMALLFGFGQQQGKGLALIPASSFGLDPALCWLRVSFSSYRQELENIVLMLSSCLRV